MEPICCACEYVCLGCERGKKNCAHDYNLPETWKEHCWSPSMLFHSSSEVPGKGKEERQKSGVLTGKQPKH